MVNATIIVATSSAFSSWSGTINKAPARPQNMAQTIPAAVTRCRGCCWFIHNQSARLDRQRPASQPHANSAATCWPVTNSNIIPPTTEIANPGFRLAIFCCFNSMFNDGYGETKPVALASMPSTVSASTLVIGCVPRLIFNVTQFSIPKYSR